MGTLHPPFCSPAAPAGHLLWGAEAPRRAAAPQSVGKVTLPSRCPLPVDPGRLVGPCVQAPGLPGPHQGQEGAAFLPPHLGVPLAVPFLPTVRAFTSSSCPVSSGLLSEGVLRGPACPGVWGLVLLSRWPCGGGPVWPWPPPLFTPSPGPPGPLGNSSAPLSLHGSWLLPLPGTVRPAISHKVRFERCLPSGS